MFSPNLIAEFQEHITQAQRIGICVHTDPDGDCLGAWCGLGSRLEAQGKSVKYFVPSKISCIFSFLSETEKFSEHIPSTYTPDLWISVDTATRDRSNLRTLATSVPIIHIDHHPADNPRGTLNLINDTISSTCELITYLLQQQSYELITPRIATLLLLGVSTDTGHFQRGKDLATTFSTASFLLSRGADLPLIVTNIYRANDFTGTKFVWELMQRIVNKDGLIRVSVNQQELEAHQLDEAKIEMLLSIMTSIKHDGVFLLFKHYPAAASPHLKCSFRTKNPTLDVSAFAKQFGGGGHRAAAACRVVSDDLIAVQEKILSTVRR